MNTVPIGELCTFTNGGTPSKKDSAFWSGNIPWITSAEIQGNQILPARFQINDYAVKKSATNIAISGTLLFVVRTGVGKNAITHQHVAFNQDIVAISPDPELLNIKYLQHFLNVNSRYFSQYSRGATIKGITREVLTRLHIPLPPLPEQKRIATILDQADALREKRRAAIAKLDELLQSVFLDMFGDPVTNPKGWEKNSLGKICEVGSSKRVFVNEIVDSGVPFFRGTEVGQLGDGQIVNPSLFITEEHYERLRAHSGVPHIGDLLLPSICPDGRIYVVSNEKPFYFKDGRVLWIKASSSSINSIYLRYFLRHLFLSDYKKIASGTTFSELKIFALKGISILVPPSDEQERFADIVKTSEQLKFKGYTHLSELDIFFSSLQQRAFRGEL